jgi:hypothetical protein
VWSFCYGRLYGELMLQKSYGKLETYFAGDLMKDGDPRLQEVLRKNGNVYYRRSYERWGS